MKRRWPGEKAVVRFQMTDFSFFAAGLGTKDCFSGMKPKAEG